MGVIISNSNINILVFIRYIYLVIRFKLSVVQYINRNALPGQAVPTCTPCDKVLVVFHFGRLPFWSSFILVIFHLGRLPFGSSSIWVASIWVIFHLCRLPFVSSSICVLFHLSRLPFVSSSI